MPGLRSAAAPLLGLPQHFVRRLDGVEAGGGFGVAGGGVGMVGLGEAAIGRLDLLEAGIALQLQNVESAHLVAASAAVAGAAPGIMAGLAIALGAIALLRLAGGGVLGGEAFEIIPVAVVFGGVGFAEIPALGAVGRFGRRPVAGIVAA